MLRAQPARWSAAIALLAAAALGITACSGASPSGSASAKAGGTLVVGITSDVLTLDPWKATQFQDVYDVLPSIYGTLTEFDKDLKVVPGLASSWKVSDDGLDVTMKLRSGVTFQSGAKLTSADVVASLQKIKDPTTAAVGAASLANVASISAPSSSTVELKLASPDASLFAGLANLNTAILPGGDEKAVATKPDGTGAFAFDARKAGQSLTLTANKDYWRGAPKLAKVEYRVIPEEQSIVSALQAGSIQLASIGDPVVAKTAKAGGVSVTQTPQLAYHALQLNARRSALTDVNVRLAVQCGVDRKQVLSTAALGSGTITGPITSPAYRSQTGDQPCPTANRSKAEAYLQKAGKTSVELDTIVSQGEYATSVDEAQNLKSQLAKVGITLNLEILDSNAYVARWIAGDFDAAVALNGGSPDPGTMYGRYFTSTGNLNKVAGYSSSELDSLFQQGRETTDASERKAIYDKVSADLTDNAAWVWLFSSYSYTATAQGVSGFTPMATGSLQFLRDTSYSG